MVQIAGVDYSSTANANWAGFAQALKANGKAFVGRYLVRDKSPGGRGITRAEYEAMRAAGIDVFFYWESSAGWMRGGSAAGIAAAYDALAVLREIGAPEDTPVYFAADEDFAESEQGAVDNCLRGAATVLGAEQVGIYGGYFVIRRCLQNGTARWFCQTLAWSGGLLLPQAHLYQWGFNAYIFGTNCDLVTAYTENYGQASMFDGSRPKPEGAPPAPPKPAFPAPEVPDWFLASVKQPNPSDADVDGARWHVARRNVVAIANTYRYSRPDTKSPRSGPPVKVRDKIAIERYLELRKPGKDGKPKTEAWLVDRQGNYLYAGRFSPRITIRTR